MALKSEKLIVFANLEHDWVPCGQLTLEEQGSHLAASQFAYGVNYLKRANALEVDPVSLSIANRAAIAGRILLPIAPLPFFGGIRDCAPDAWGRRVIEAKRKAPPNSLAESQYLLDAGSERIGALDIRRQIKDAPSAGVSAIDQLAYLMEAADRIQDGLPIPERLEAIFLVGSGLGGARPKASVRDSDGILWIAKFSNPNDAFDIPQIECATLLLAKKAGLKVPSVKTEMLGDRRIMLIRRFDRYWSKQGEIDESDFNLFDTVAGQQKMEHRMGFVSGLTLAACDELDSKNKSYADLEIAIRRYCHPSVILADSEELFKRMVFNIFVSNDDDHLRNHGFVWDPRLPGWRLSPLYDVLPRASIASERFLHLAVGNQGRLATIDNALSSAGSFMLTEKKACEFIGEVWRVTRQWKTYFDEFNVSAAEMDKISPAFRHIDDVSSPAVRALLG